MKLIWLLLKQFSEINSKCKFYTFTLKCNQRFSRICKSLNLQTNFKIFAHDFSVNIVLVFTVHLSCSYTCMFNILFFRYKNKSFCKPIEKFPMASTVEITSLSAVNEFYSCILLLIMIYVQHKMEDRRMM